MLKQIFAAAFAVFALSAAVAADRLAIAEPVGKGGIKPEEVEAVWNMLEASVDGGYELVSRSALKQMLTEIGLTVSSDLMDLNSTQKARLGEVKTVKYILVSSVGKIGARVNFSLMAIDASTGAIDPEKKASLTVDNLDELSDKLKDTLLEIGLGRAVKKRGVSAMLWPVIKVENAPGYLADDFNAGFENYLLTNGVRLQNLQSVTKILRKNKIDNLNEAEPAMYVRIGELLRVDTLLQPMFNRFSVEIRREHIAASKRTIVRCLGNFEGHIRIISAQTGEIVASIPFRLKLDFDDVDADTADWTAEDYGKYLIESALPDLTKATVSKLQ
jgi:hypothetical protein